MEVVTTPETAQRPLAQSGTPADVDPILILAQKTGLTEGFVRNCVVALARYQALGTKDPAAKRFTRFEAHLLHEKGGIGLVSNRVVGKGSFKQVRRGWFVSLLDWSCVQQAFIAPRNSRMKDKVAIKRMVSEFRVAFMIAKADAADVIDAPSHVFWDELRPGIPWAMAPMANGDLEKLPPTSEEELARFVQHGATALSLTHSFGFVHNDVKAPNFLRVGGKFKLTDFGLATPANAQIGFKGTPFLVSHEAFGDKYVAKPAKDIYGLGVLIVKFIKHVDESSGSGLADWYPDFIEWSAIDVEEPHQFGVKLKRLSRLRTWMTPSGSASRRTLIEIAESCLHITPCKRPTADQILKKI